MSNNEWIFFSPPFQLIFLSGITVCGVNEGLPTELFVNGFCGIELFVVVINQNAGCNEFNLTNIIHKLNTREHL